MFSRSDKEIAEYQGETEIVPLPMLVSWKEGFLYNWAAFICMNREWFFGYIMHRAQARVWRDAQLAAHEP